jgi:23S rRNA (uracil1939-C5)-methyltransferase
VFVEGALAGETVTVDIVDERRDFARGRTARVVVASPDRVEPPCPNVARGCGGCDLQHATLPAQLAMKRAIVAEALIRIGRVSDLPDIHTVQLPATGYRTTVRGLARDGRFALHRRHSHDAIEIEHCLVADPLLDELMREGRYPDGATVTLRCGARTGERLAIIAPSATGTVLPPDVRVVGADELRHGKRAWIHERVDGQLFRVSAQSFFQIRPDGADALVDAVRRTIGPLGEKSTVVDLYAGVGLFAATVAPDASVVAVERSASSVADARRNLTRRRAQIIRATVEAWHPTPADAVVADPSRDGLGRVGADKLAATAAPRAALVSCDPAALARDVGLLRDRGFELTGCTLVDLFAHTSHIEVVSAFTRR